MPTLDDLNLQPWEKRPGRRSIPQEAALTVDGGQKAYSGPKAWSFRYEQIITLIIEDPSRRQKDIAQKMGVSQAWLSTIMRTDMFKDLLQQRIGEHHEAVSRSTIRMAENVAQLALERMEERLEADSANPVPFGELRETADAMLEKLGYGLKGAAASGPNSNPQLHLHVEASTLAEARRLMHDAQQRSLDNRAGDDAIEILPAPSDPVPSGR